MRICSRCNNEVKKQERVCTRCGFSLMKDEYGRRVYPNSNYIDNKKKNTTLIKNNKKVNEQKPVNIVASLIAVIICVMFSLFVSVFEIIRDSKIEKTEIQEFIFIEEYTDSIRLIAEDYYKIWSLWKVDNTITLEDIDEVTSLSTVDMISSECELLKENGDVSSALKCVIDTHYNIGTYSDAYNDLNYLYDLIEEFSDNKKYDTLVKIYNILYELYYLPEDYLEYNSYEKKLYDLTYDLDYLLESLNY